VRGRRAPSYIAFVPPLFTVLVNGRRFRCTIITLGSLAQWALRAQRRLYKFRRPPSHPPPSFFALPLVGPPAMELSELNSRLKHATLLRSQNSPPLQSFTLGPDGIFRCVLPIPISIPVVTLVRPQTSPVTHAVFLAPRSGREVDNVSSRLEDKLQKVRFAGAEHLKDQLAIYKRAQRDKKILFVKSSGHHYVNENVRRASERERAIIF